MHNKREHLQGKQHIRSVAGDIKREMSSDYDTDYMGNTSSISFSTSLDESSLDGIPSTGNVTTVNTGMSVTDAVSNLIAAVSS